ncbi:MAG: acyl-CoA dehydrogenase family protein [Verrucomicrobiota bacterium]
MIDFEPSPEANALAEKVGNFARDQLGDTPQDRFPREKWEACAKAGIFSMGGAVEHGGEGAAFSSCVHAMEELGYHCAGNGLPFALNCQIWTVQHPIERYGSEALRSGLLREMWRGEKIGAHALTEAKSGSDAFAIEAVAEACEGGYRISGKKTYISLGPVADVALVFASTNPGAGKWGISAFVLDLHSDGVTRFEPREKLGLTNVPMCDLEFSRVFVPESHRLGPEGAGMSISNASLAVERCSILSAQLGAMRRQLQESVAASRQTLRFGKPVSEFQSVSHRVADMRIRLETSRLLLQKTAWQIDQGENAMLDAALLKLHLSESFAASSLDAVRNLGAAGYMMDSNPQADLRDAIGGLLYAGTSDIQRNLIAQLQTIS